MGAVAVVVGAGAVLAGNASAAPYNPNATITLDASCVAVGGKVSVSGQGFGERENIRLDLRSPASRLDTTRSGAAGGFSAEVRLPAGVSGTRTIVATGASSGTVASARISLAGCTTDRPGPAPDLPKTGSAGLAGVGVTGLALFGGGLFLVSAKHRRSSS